jgi:enoyl-CoA hydratase
MNIEVVQFSIENSIGNLQIHRPEALNALNSDVLASLDHHLDKIELMDYDNLRVLVITGSGEKSFVAGADIKQIHQLNQAQALVFAERGQKIFRRIEKLKIPVIAAVNGFAFGGGLELALSCDFIYASENAKLGLPEVSLGLIPGFGGTVRLTRVVGKNRAKEMILSGLPVTASEALHSGLANKVFPFAELLVEVKKIAETIASRGPKAVEFAKKSLAHTEDQKIDEEMTFEAQSFSRLFQTQDVFEGTSAFIEKRKPVFQGR